MTPNPKKSPDPRRTVFEILVGVLEKNVSLDEALEEGISTAGFEGRDRAFIKNLSTLIFRHLAFIDKSLSAYLKRPLPKKALWVRHWLRIGAAQILFMDVPAHAAVDTTVSAIDRMKKPGAKTFRGLANAIMRNVARDRDQILRALEREPEAILPRWIRGRWEDFYGPESVRAIARVLVEKPPLDLNVKDSAEVTALVKTLEALEIFPGVLRLSPKGSVTGLPGFSEGKWWVQDLAAGLPARLLGEVKGKNVLDLCAAPGGKTLSLAAMGAMVTAVDISKGRLKRLRENLKRTGLNAKVIENNLLKFKPAQNFDCILLDAPCSSTGTLRRHPDVAYHRGKADIERLSEIQLKMLAHSFSLLTPGGVLVYCVCSLEPEEGENLIAGFLDTNPTIRRLPITPGEVGGHEDWITAAGDLRTLPSFLGEKGGMDGFFAARLTMN